LFATCFFWWPADSFWFSDSCFESTELRRAGAPALCIWRRRSSLMLSGLTCASSSYVGAPSLDNCKPGSWLDGVIPHPSTYSCSSLRYSGCSPSLDSLGGGDHPRTTCSEEAACSGPKCGQSAGSFNIDSGHFWILEIQD
jgi:hypothetical protein